MGCWYAEKKNRGMSGSWKYKFLTAAGRENEYRLTAWEGAGCEDRKNLY